MIDSLKIMQKVYILWSNWRKNKPSYYLNKGSKGSILIDEAPHFGKKKAAISRIGRFANP